MNSISLAKYIDHTNLKPFATENDIVRLCEEAVHYGFAAVCVNPYWTATASNALRSSNVKVCSVVGFPLGATPTSIKVAEAESCLEDGADEIDMVINIGEAKSGNWDFVENEIRVLAELCKAYDSKLKVIFENCYLKKEEIILACRASVAAGADYVKTSTGFGSSGAVLEDVVLMVKEVAGKCKVKAAGGIRDKSTAVKMIEAGADRIGTSSGIQIVTPIVL